MIDLENTEIALKYRTNKELRKAYWLFRFMSMNKWVKLGKHFLNFAIYMRLPVSWLLKPTIYKHFCGGENLVEASQTIDLLEQYHVKAILDYSVEGKENEESFAIALKETLATVEFAAQNQHVHFAVFKPSALGRQKVLEKASKNEILDKDSAAELNNFKGRFEILCKTAYNLGVPIMVDAEHSHYQQIIDDVCEEMMEKYNKEKAIVYNTLQMYRSDRMDLLRNMYENAVHKEYFLGIKFVRGAYMEKERERAQNLGYPSPIQPDKITTDHDFNDALRFSMSHIDRISIFEGTHNEESCLLLTQLMAQANIEKNDNRIWFSQLYGMSDNISFNLANDGYNVAKYIPFGPLKHVLPYLIRRAEENTSVKGQTSREMLLLQKELKRRKKLQE
jgi:proline dehydrogenase